MFFRAASELNEYLPQPATVIVNPNSTATEPADTERIGVLMHPSKSRVEPMVLPRRKTQVLKWIRERLTVQSEITAP